MRHHFSIVQTAIIAADFKNLADYLNGFQYTCAVLRNPENLERVAFELAQDNINEGVRYIEARFAPQLNAGKNMSVPQALRAVVLGTERAAKKHNLSSQVKSGADLPFHFAVIACAMRRFVKGMSPYYDDFLRVMAHAGKKEVFSAASLELARAVAELVQKENLPITGFDLAGEEAGYPAIYHKQAYDFAHKNFIKKTVHAGEAYGPESIFQAITECHANRLGHGTFLFAHEMIKDPDIKDKKKYVENLADYIASQRIAVEVCLTSNLQTTPSIKSVKEHPLKKMIEHGMSVTLCTDNRLVSDTTASGEFELAANNLNLSPKQLRNLVVAGFKSSFFPGSFQQKRDFIKTVIDKYETLEKML
ncbi:MAG: adenosine deaminase family protein [Elusimicrobia bacterium]|nr:adenosine deaminase family protein [Elusimicrobiota bacterium]